MQHNIGANSTREAEMGLRFKHASARHIHASARNKNEPIRMKVGFEAARMDIGSCKQR